MGRAFAQRGHNLGTCGTNEIQSKFIIKRSDLRSEFRSEFMILQGSARPEVRSELYERLRARI